MTAWLARARSSLEILLSGRPELYGINRRNVELVYALNQRRHYPLADDKILCKEWLTRAGVPVPPTLAVCSGLGEIEAALDRVHHRGSFVVKPAHGSGGEGIVLLGDRLEPGAWAGSGGVRVDREDLRQHMARIVFGAFSGDLSDRALVEERIDVHPDVLALSGAGVPDVRIILREKVAVLAMMRVPTLRSGGRANLHQGAIGVALDLETGRSLRARLAGREARFHPDSGRDLVGVVLPGWGAIRRTAQLAADALPLGYLGVDVLIDRARGPLVVEVNVRPGLEIQNVHGHGLGRSLRESA